MEPPTTYAKDRDEARDFAGRVLATRSLCA
jgi:hypothetical protein